MREGSEAPEDGEGSKDDLEGFRKEVMEKGVDGVDEETLEEWREGIADKEDEEGAGPREGSEEGEEADAKGEVDGTGKDPEKGELDAGTAQAEAGPGKEVKDQKEGIDETPTETADAKSEEEVEGGRAEASAKDPPADGGQQHSEQPDKPIQERNAETELEKPSVIELAEPSQKSGSYTRNDDQVLVVEHASPGRDKDDQAETLGFQHLQTEGVLAPSGVSVSGSGETVPERDVNFKENTTVMVEDRGSTPLPLNHAVGEVARYSQEDSHIVVIQQGRGSPPEGAEKSPREERGSELDVVRRVVEHMGSPMLILPGSRFPDNIKEGVFEVKLTREKEPAREYALYCNHTAGQQKTYLDLRHMGAEIGEGVRIKSIELLLHKSFAEGYNRNPPKGLENTRLVVYDGNLALGVRDKELGFSSFVFRTREGKAVLDGELQGAGRVKIAKSSTEFDFRLRDHSLVESIREEGGSYKLEYRRTSNEQFPHIKLVRREDGLEHQSFEDHKIELDPAGLGIDRPLSLSAQMIRMEMSPQNRAMAWEYWRLASSERERRIHIGDVGQVVAEHALRKSEFGIVSSEPFGNPIFSRRHVSEITGPDLICETREQAVVVYVKHWLEADKGLAEAMHEVEVLGNSKEKLVELGRDLGMPVVGGLAIEIRWSYKESRGVIYTKYFNYRKEIGRATGPNS